MKFAKSYSSVFFHKHLPCLLLGFIIFFSVSAATTPPLDSVYINSGNPAFPFPQFLPYQNGALGNLATHSGIGVTHAEMEQTIRDAYRIMMNRAYKTGTALNGVSYIKFRSNPDCSEGDGYAMLGAASMADKKTFDGLWLWIHDNAMNKVTSYSTGQAAPAYQYSTLPGWTNTTGANSATDGDVDIGLALFTAYMQWGEFMGINDSKGNPISYKHDLIEFLKGLTDTLVFSANGLNYLSGDIGLDGYIKNGDSWNEMTAWAGNTAVSGFPRAPQGVGPAQVYVDYAAPSYFHEFADFLSKENATQYAWNIKQFQRGEASSDWIIGQMLSNQSMIPYAGHIDLSANNIATFSKMNEGEDFRFAWRTTLNHVWHGNPAATWDPASHQVKTGTSNTYERDIGQRYAKFLWDQRQLPWNNPCIAGKDNLFTYWGPEVIGWSYTVLGVPPAGGEFFLNWVPGAGSPSAVISQDYTLMAELYRYSEIEWDVETPGDGYLTSVPVYYHGWFRLLGLLTLSGNYHPPSMFKPASNMKCYTAIDKTFGFENDSVTYTIDYRNYGSLDAQGVTIVDTLHKDFVFLSASGNGKFDPATNIVSWNIGIVPGFKTSSGIGPTKGTVTLKVKVGNATQKQYRNRATIACSNGTGWTSNEYPNDISSVMKRNFLDIAKRALIIKKSVSIPYPKAGTDVQFTINFKNTSDAGWIDGGRPGVHFSFSQTAPTGSATMNTMRFRLFHDADEAYIDYGNYRVSYFLYDSINTCIQGVGGCATGWQKTQTITEGIIDKTTVKLLQEMITPGQDSLGRWNQRIVIQFSDPTDPNRTINLATIDHHLSEYRGMRGRIHRGGVDPLRLVWFINSSSWTNVNWATGWSWDAKASDNDGGVYFPVTSDWTDLDNPNLPVTTWNRKSCQTATHTVNNVLVEEWDGYTWRRVAGNGPLPGRDVNNVTIRDTIPAGLTFTGFTGPSPFGIAPAINGNVITWTKPKMQVKDSGAISFTAKASSSCPLKTKKLVNRAWISADKESAVADSAIVTLTCDSINVIPPTKSTLLLKDPSNQTIPSGDTARIDTTAFNIVVNDKDQDLSSAARDTISAIVKNPSSGDSINVKLIETGNATGIFQTASPIMVASQGGPNKIATTGGETVYIIYTDQFDSTDVSQAYLITVATFPVPAYGWLLDANGDGRADSAVAIFTKTLTTPPDSLRFYFPDQINFQTVKAGQGTMRVNGNSVFVTFATPFPSATTAFSGGASGNAFSYIMNGNIVKKFQFPVADSIGPIIAAAQVVERATGSSIDTLYATFSEALQPASLIGASLILIKNNTPTVISIDSYQMLTPLRFALALASGAPQPQPGDSLRINPVGPVRDLYGNEAHQLNPPVVLTLKQIPPAILSAYYVDRSSGFADGFVDTAIIQFNKKTALSGLSFLLDWGNGLSAANIRGDTLAYRGTDSMSVGIALRTVFPYSGALRTSGAMNLFAQFDDFPGESRKATVQDSAAPVIDTATYFYNTSATGGCDTLAMSFSEPATVISGQNANPFVLSSRSTGARYSLALYPLPAGNAGAKFCATPTGVSPQNGDTIWINGNASVADLLGNYQNNPNNRKVILKVLRPVTQWKVYVVCNPFSAGPTFTCAAGKAGVPGTVIEIAPAKTALTLPSITPHLMIFDFLGNCIYEQQSALKRPDGNAYYFVWDGRNKNGRYVGSGAYRANVIIVEDNGASSVSQLKIGVKR